MRHLKLYEEMREPQVGDYVYVEDNTSEVEEFRNEFDSFLNNNIGKIINIDKEGFFEYIIRFNNIPKNIEDYFGNESMKWTREFEREEILYFSDNKKDVEVEIQSSKFNL